MRFLPDSFWVSFRYGIVTITSFTLSIFFARLVSKETYGMYQYVLSALALFSVLSLPGLTYASLKSVVAGDSKAVARGVMISFLLSLVGSLALLCFAGFKIWSGETIIGWALLVGALFLPFFYAPSAWYTYYHGRKMYRLVEVLLAISTLSVFGALTIALWLGSGVSWLLAVYLGMTSAYSWGFFFLAKKKYDKEGEGKVNMRFALIVTIQKFVLGAADSIPIVLMGTFFGYAATALFQIASAPIVLLTGYLGALLTLRLPGFFRGERMTSKRLLIHALLVGAVLTGFLVLFLRFFFLFIYGEAYEEALRIAWWLVPLVFLLPLKTYLTGIFSAQERNKEVIIIYAIANTLTLIFFLAFRHMFPFESLAVGLLYVLNFLLVLPLLSLYFHQEFKKDANLSHYNDLSR